MGFGQSPTKPYIRFLSSPKEESSSTHAILANEAYVIPIFIPRTLTIDQIRFITAGAAGNAILGIYTNGLGVSLGPPAVGGGGPTFVGTFDSPMLGTLLLSLGPIPVANSLVFTTSFQLQQGFYWLVLVFDTTGGTFTRTTSGQNMDFTDTTFSNVIGIANDTCYNGGSFLPDPLLSFALPSWTGTFADQTLVPRPVSNGLFGPDMYARVASVDA